MSNHDLEPRPSFPPLHWATEEGILMVGGLLTARWVLAAYRRGIFPWPMRMGDQAEVLAWFSPDPRAVLELDQLVVSRRLARRMRTGRYRMTCDTDFGGVIRACAAPRDEDEPGTWITPDMIRVYSQLHQLGHTHSIEVWENETLVGGLYGVSIGGFFAGESMFHRCLDGSKMAMVALVAHLRARRFSLLDVQQATDHAVRMGATSIRRPQFVERLKTAVAQDTTFGTHLDLSELPRLLTR